MYDENEDINKFSILFILKKNYFSNLDLDDC